MLTKLYQFIFVFTFASLSIAKDFKKCSDAKGSGICKGLVNKAEKACKKFQKKKEETAAKMHAVQSTQFNRQSDFAAQAQSYREIQSLAQQDAADQKACQKKMKGYKSECDDLCDVKPDGETCGDGKEEIDKIKKLCQKNEVAAEMVSGMAAQDAAMFEKGGPGKGDTANNGTTGGGGASASSLTGIQGYLIDNPTDYGGEDDSSDSDVGGNAVNTQSTAGGESDGSGLNGGITSGLAGNTAGAGGSGGTAGDTSGAAGIESSGLGGNRRLSGSGSTNTGEEVEGSATQRVGGAGGINGDGSRVDGNAPPLPGYMLWGTPKRKKPVEKRY